MMNHLTVDEVIEFVSSDSLTGENLILSETVIGHIRKCKDCFDFVKASQIVHDEFVRMCTTDDFKNYLYNTVKSEKKKESSKTMKTLNKYI